MVGKTIVCNSKNGISIKEINDVLYKKSAKAKYYNINQNEFYIGENLYIKLEHDEMDIILDRLLVGTKIKELYNVNQGIVSGADKFTDSHKLKYKLEYEKGMGIFVVNPVEAINLERNLLGEFFKNSDIKRYYCNTISDKRIIYTDKFTEIEKYPLIYSHLKNFKIILESKRESQQGKLPWFSLHWGRDKKIFISEKIIAPQRSYINSFAYNKAEWFSSADVYYITYISDKKILLKYTLALLNSKLYYMWLYKRGKRKGEMLELYATPLEQIPIKEVGIDIQNKFIEIVDRIIEMKETNKDTTDLENQIDEMVYDLYELTEEEKDVVRSFGR